MTPSQRDAALRLANTETQWRALKWEQDVIALLRELAAEPEPDHFVGPMAEQLLQVIAGIWHEHPDYSLRQTLEALNALMLPAEPVNPAPGYCKHCKQYTIEEPLPAEPVQEPDRGWLEAAVAWEVCGSIHATFAKGKDALFKTRHADFVKHAEDARAKAMLYAAPQQRQPLTEAQIVEISVDCALVTASDIYFARAIEAAHGIKGTP